MSRLALRVAVILLALAPALLVSGRVTAQTPEELIPFEKLDVGLRNELWKVSQKFTARRKVDEQSVDCAVDTYEWLLHRLPLASIASRELDLGKYVVDDKGPDKFSIDDKDGAFANCQRVFEESGRTVIVARGFLESTVLPKTDGTGVIVVRYHQDPADPKKTLTDAFVFFRAASDSLHLLTAPFRDKVGELVGGKMDGLVNCAAKVSAAVEKDPRKVYDALVRSKKAADDELAAFKKRFLLQ